MKGKNSEVNIPSGKGKGQGLMAWLTLSHSSRTSASVQEQKYMNGAFPQAGPKQKQSSPSTHMRESCVLIFFIPFIFKTSFATGSSFMPFGLSVQLLCTVFKTCLVLTYQSTEQACGSKW